MNGVMKVIEDTESANRINSSSKMHEAVKKLNRKSLPANMFVYDKENKSKTKWSPDMHNQI